MEKEFYLLVISLSMLHHQVLANKANLCNVTESYFVEVTKTETVLEFKKPTGFHLFGMLSNSNKYENITKTVQGVEKRERIIEQCCTGFKQNGDECVPINDTKPVTKPSTTTSTTAPTPAPTIAATEPAIKPEPSSETPTTPPVTESKTTASVEPSPTEPKAPEPAVTEIKIVEHSTEIPAPQPIPSELPTEPKSATTEQSFPSTEPSPVSPTEPKALEPVSESNPVTELITPLPIEPTLPPQHLTNPELVNELVTDPTATDQTTSINGRRRRNIDIPDTNTEQDEPDLKFNTNDRLRTEKEYNEIVVSDIEDENDDDNTTWIQVLELFSFGAVVFLLVITVQASYDGDAIFSLWSGKNKNQIDSYGEFWIYDSQVSLEEV